MCEHYTLAEKKAGAGEFVEELAQKPNVKLAIATSSNIEFFGKNVHFKSIFSKYFAVIVQGN